MKLWVLVTILFISLSSVAKESSNLVDVDKNSKLSDYFNKINKKVTADDEEKPLDLDKKIEESDQDIALEEDESKIPLNISADTKKKTSSLSPLNKMMISIVGLLLFAVAVFAWIQKMGKRAGHSTVAKNINILAKKPIGSKKDLMLIQVAGETILLGVTDHNINHIKTLSLLDDELPNFTNPKFSQQLKQKVEETKISDEKEELDGFAVSALDDVKDIVTKRFSI